MRWKYSRGKNNSELIRNYKKTKVSNSFSQLFWTQFSGFENGLFTTLKIFSVETLKNQQKTRCLPEICQAWINLIFFNVTTLKKSDSTRQIRYQGAQRDITLRDSLQKFIALHKARSVYLWGWCRMLVEIKLLPWGWPNGVPSMPKNLKKVQIYPNLVITLLEVNSLTLHNLHYIVLALCKAAWPAQIKEKIKVLVL